MADKPRLGIIGGAGMMGSHMAELCRKLFDVSIYDIDGEKAATVSKEVRCRVSPAPEKLIRESDLTIFSVPTSVVEQEMSRLIPLAKGGSCITDVTSVKKRPVETMAESAPDRVDYFGMHPNYRATVSPHNQTVVICPGRPEEGCRYQEMIEKTFRKKGAKITYMDPEEADFYSDINQALVHDSYLSFMGVLLHLMESGQLDMKKLFATATPNSKRFMENAGRMLGGKPHVYAGIQLFKQGAVGMIDQMKEALERQRELLVGDGGKPLGEAQNDFEKLFLSLRAVLGEEYVRQACTRTDQEYEIPGGVQIYYPTHRHFAMGTETFLRTLGAKSFQPYKEQIKVTSIPAGALGRVSEEAALAKTRLYKSRDAGAEKESATAFYCSNRTLSPGKKGIRFTQAVIVNPDSLQGIGQDELYETVVTAIRDAEERDLRYERVQLLARFDDPVLRFYDTVEKRKDLKALGPWVVSKSY